LNSVGKQDKTTGLISGMSWESMATYYKERLEQHKIEVLVP